MKNNKTDNKKIKLTNIGIICLRILILIFTCTLLFSGFKIFSWYLDKQKINQLEKEIEEITDYEFIEEEGILINPPTLTENEEIKEDDVEKEETTVVENDYWYYVSFPFYKVDFTNLINKNSDTVAFIHLNNSNINYPIVQTNNNDFYLKHAFDKSYNSAGWVFMDYRNKLNPLSDNIVIYGHARLDNVVFGTLSKVLTEKWQSNKDNYIINFSTPNANYIYQIFSIYTIKAESYYITTDFSSIEEKEEWIKTMVDRNTVSKINTTANANDKILTLSTCYNNEGIRLVVQAKLIKSDSNQ